MPIQSKNNQARKQVQFISANKPRLKLLTIAKNKTITVKGTAITVLQGETTGFISLTEIARYKDPSNMDSIIQNWLRNRNTIELLGFWENIYNPDFKPRIRGV